MMTVLTLHTGRFAGDITQLVRYVMAVGGARREQEDHRHQVPEFLASAAVGRCRLLLCRRQLNLLLPECGQLRSMEEWLLECGIDAAR